MIVQRLSESDANAWRARRCPAANPAFDLAAARAAGAVIGSESTEALPGVRLAFASRALLLCAGPEPRSTLIWVREWGVWESSEHLPLYGALIGDPGASHEALVQHPGHGIDVDDQDQAISLILLCLAFGWGFSIFHEGTSVVVHCNHDGIIWLSGGTTAQAKALADAVFATA